MLNGCWRLKRVVGGLLEVVEWSLEVVELLLNGCWRWKRMVGGLFEVV